jgi:hypothetical protein
MKELNEAYFDLGVLVERCHQSQRIISSYASTFFDLCAESAVVGAPVDLKISLMPMASDELMRGLSFIPVSHELPDEIKRERLAEVRKSIAGFEDLHRQRSKLSYMLQCAHADHMVKLWSIGYTIKNGSVVPL